MTRSNVCFKIKGLFNFTVWVWLHLSCSAAVTMETHRRRSTQLQPSLIPIQPELTSEHTWCNLYSYKDTVETSWRLACSWFITNATCFVSRCEDSPHNVVIIKTHVITHTVNMPRPLVKDGPTFSVLLEYLLFFLKTFWGEIWILGIIKDL